jgi:lysozyme
MDKLRANISQAEGLRLKPYRDSEGFLSIGYGRCLDTRGISRAEAEMLLDEDIFVACEQYRKIPKTENLNTNRQRVITEMIFNLGLAGCLNFKRMWAAIEQGDFNLAAIEMLDSKWATQVKGRAIRMADDMRAG